MKRNRTGKPDGLQPAENKLLQNPADNIPVFLVLGLCLLAVSIFSNYFTVFQEKSAPEAVQTGKYVWITGSPELNDGLYIFSTEQLEGIYPEFLSQVSNQSDSSEFDSRVLALQYKSNLLQQAKLPPAVANIFFKPISINRADKDALSTLPGIGPTLAERIVKRREGRGPFRSKDELLHISGIGPKKLARLKDSIILD